MQAKDRPDPLVARARGAVILLVLGVLVLVTTALSGLSTGVKEYGLLLGAGLRVVAAVLAIAVNSGMFVLAFRLLTTSRVRWRDIVPGAVAAAVAWQILQEVGTYYVGHELKGASATYGLFGIVLGLLAWLYLASVVVLLCAEVNVVRVRRLWPRSLPSAFVDNRALTEADEAAYASYAVRERRKSVEQVGIEFQEDAMMPGTTDNESVLGCSWPAAATGAWGVRWAGAGAGGADPGRRARPVRCRPGHDLGNNGQPGAGLPRRQHRDRLAAVDRVAGRCGMHGSRPTRICG